MRLVVRSLFGPSIGWGCMAGGSPQLYEACLDPSASPSSGAVALITPLSTGTVVIQAYEYYLPWGLKYTSVNYVGLFGSPGNDYQYTMT